MVQRCRVQISTSARRTSVDTQTTPRAASRPSPLALCPRQTHDKQPLYSQQSPQQPSPAAAHAPLANGDCSRNAPCCREKRTTRNRSKCTRTRTQNRRNSPNEIRIATLFNLKQRDIKAHFLLDYIVCAFHSSLHFNTYGAMRLLRRHADARRALYRSTAENTTHARQRMNVMPKQRVNIISNKQT